MSHLLINHSQDLRRLRDEGYEIEVKGGYLCIHHVPYVNSKKEVMLGVLVSELTLIDSKTTSTPSTHVIHFIGDIPCEKDGTIKKALLLESRDQLLFEGITINHSFSNRPQTGYANYYDKISRYVEIFSGPARSIDTTITAKTFRVITDNGEESVFNYIDTNSSRANISAINLKLKLPKIAIIGLGGTGGYILDLVAKTPVVEIHIFDGDVLQQHNAFRSPGAVSIEQLDRHLSKVDYYSEIYSKMRKGIISHNIYIDEDTLSKLEEMSYVFICVDNNSARKLIIDYLLKRKISFSDVGLGVNVVKDSLIGIVRVTSASSTKYDHLSSRVPMGDNDDNEYTTNIQIADLNSLNAVLAVIKWKKMFGFYQDLEEEHHCTYSINVAQLTNEDLTA